MAASRSAKLILGVTGVAGGSYFMYKWGYPYTRCIYMSLTKQDEATAFEVAKMEKAFSRLQEAENCHSLLKKHLTRKVFDKLKYKKTMIGGTLYDIIKSGAENLDDEVGVYAADVESYRMFAPLLDPIIEDYHTGFSPSKDKQPKVDLGEGREKTDFPELDPTGEFIKSTRIRCGRNVKGYPFHPLLTGDDYMILQEKAKMILSGLKDDLQGEYYPLARMTQEVQQRLINDHFLFKEGDRYLKAANACNYWPQGRGIFHNAAKTFLVWVNEEDHMRLISMQAGSNVGEVLERLNRAIRQIDAQKLIFARDDRLGWLTFCPTNLGSTVRASVHVKLTKLAAREDFKEICSKLNLQVRGIDGEHSKGEGGVYDISNKRRLGVSEYQAVKEMYDGVKELIEMEKGETRGR